MIRQAEPLKAISRCLRHVPGILLGFLVIAACSPPDISSGNVEIADLEFEDPVLQSCVLATASRNDWNVSGQVTELECTSSGTDKIRKLGGIEALINLQSLDLSNHAISDPVLLDELHHLTILDLGHNDIQLVHFSRLHETLLSLILDDNRIHDISWLATFYRLEHLSLNQNRLRLIPAVVGLESIKSLDLSHNEIDDAMPLESLESIESINLQGNPLNCEAIKNVMRLLPSDVKILTDCELPEPKVQKD